VFSGKLLISPSAAVSPESAPFWHRNCSSPRSNRMSPFSSFFMAELSVMVAASIPYFLFLISRE
jgi:hypothetical protein